MDLGKSINVLGAGVLWLFFVSFHYHPSMAFRGPRWFYTKRGGEGKGKGGSNTLSPSRAFFS